MDHLLFVVRERKTMTSDQKTFWQVFAIIILIIFVGAPVISLIFPTWLIIAAVVVAIVILVPKG